MKSLNQKSLKTPKQRMGIKDTQKEIEIVLQSKLKLLQYG